ncbi:MAG: glycosyltransferase family 9 protein, partial [Candidatus Krumholzibacteria bacterium]|nr:glycosyltransferase family 9 protein [Candidatus Krumholzibacteria bacterium]
MDSKILDLSKMDGIRSILVVRLKALGDIVLSLPVISALRRHFPRARICYLCWGVYAEALMGETGLDEVLELPRNFTGQISLIRKLRLQKIDLVIDLLSSPRSALITFLSGARLRVGMNVGRHNWCYHYVLPRIVSRDGKRVKCYTLESNRGMLRMLNLDAAGLGLRIGFPAAGIENDWADAYVEELGVDRTRLVGIVPG